MDSYETVELKNYGKFIVGKVVTHPRFGNGKVLGFDDSGSPTITVQFDDKTRLLAFDVRTRTLMNLITDNEKRREKQTIKKDGQLYLVDWEEEDMAESLLAHLYTRISGSQEDVATVSLKYIIDSSPALNAAYNKLLSDALKIEIPADVRYKDQSIGENMERPDMSGTDSEGNEIILCEMKFYAGLTDNQPNGYLDRLIDKGGKALVFICPKARQVSLWSKVKDLCEEHGRSLFDEDGFRITVDGIAMAVVTWAEIIDTLRLTASSVAVSSLPDIAQLSGFCNMMDQDAFIPFTPEELGSESARKENRYADIVDAVIDKLETMKDLHPCKKGKTNAFRTGYWRNINIKGHRIEVWYHRDIWIHSLADTPIWLLMLDEEGKQPDSYKKYLESKDDKLIHHHWDGRIVQALTIQPYVAKDDIVDDLIDQIINHIEELDGAVS